jgi:hypothetical protein
MSQTLTAWEEFEHNFAYLFSAFVGTDTDELPASRAYGAVLTFKGRAEMVGAAAEAFFFLVPVDPVAAQTQQTLRNDILGAPGSAKGIRKTTGLIDEATQLAGRRNEIAHGIVRQLWHPNLGALNTLAFNESNATSWGFAVVPSAYATNKNKLMPSSVPGRQVRREGDYRYASAEIDRFADAFRSIKFRAGSLGLQLHGHAKFRGPTTFP